MQIRENPYSGIFYAIITLKKWKQQKSKLTLMLTARSRITKILMAGITHHKQKCLIFIMVPLKKEENVPSQRQKKTSLD